MTWCALRRTALNERQSFRGLEVIFSVSGCNAHIPSSIRNQVIFRDARSSILSSLQLLSSRPSIPLTSIWHIAFHHLTSVTGDTSWPLETWGMKLGKSVRNIRCGHNYRDRQADLAKLGLKFKKTPVGPTSAKPDPSACPPKIEPDPDPTSPPVISSTSTIPIPTPPSEASPAN